VRDVRILAVEDKWGASVAGSIESEVRSLLRQLVGRASLLAERYNLTLEDLEREVDAVSAKVSRHLLAMGVQS